MKGIAKLYFYKTIEVIFCFIFTFFPNLSIEMHLQINREKIERARQQVNNLLPDSYPAEVNANINPWFLSYDVKKIYFIHNETNRHETMALISPPMACTNLGIYIFNNFLAMTDLAMDGSISPYTFKQSRNIFHC